MHQIRCRLGPRLRPRWGAYSAPPDQLGLRGPTSKGRGEGRKGQNPLRKNLDTGLLHSLVKCSQRILHVKTVSQKSVPYNICCNKQNKQERQSRET